MDKRALGALHFHRNTTKTLYKLNERETLYSSTGGSEYRLTAQDGMAIVRRPWWIFCGRRRRGVRFRF